MLFSVLKGLSCILFSYWTVLNPTHFVKAVAVLFMQAGVGGADLVEWVQLHVDRLVLLLQVGHVRIDLGSNLEKKKLLKKYEAFKGTK